MGRNRTTSYGDDVEPLIGNRPSGTAGPLTAKRKCWALTLLILSIVALGATGYVIYYLIERNKIPDDVTCENNGDESSSNCSLYLVESIPEGLTYPPDAPVHPSTFETWMKLLRSAKTSVDIASMYWTLRGNDSGFEHPTDWQGEAVFSEINATRQRGVTVRIIQTYPSGPTFDDKETALLATVGIEVRRLNMERLLGSGVLHTKLWIVDGKHFLSGSANTDWRSLTQVKELCHVTWDCPCAVHDVQKAFDIYWQMAVDDSSIPTKWAASLTTRYNEGHRMQMKINHVPATAYIGSSPPQFCSSGRTDSLTSIIKTIESAQKSVSIAVMDFFPTTLYTNPRTYWPDVDDALRKAAFDRGVHVRVMGSLWDHTRSDMRQYLLSLAAINDVMPYVKVEVRLFQVNASEDQAKIPYARVNHNKYMVTDNAAYIGTSNWSKDYFTNTCGVDFVINQTDSIIAGVPVSRTIQGQLQAVFDRDWNSPYALHVEPSSSIS